MVFDYVHLCLVYLLTLFFVFKALCFSSSFICYCFSVIKRFPLAGLLLGLSSHFYKSLYEQHYIFIPTVQQHDLKAVKLYVVFLGRHAEPIKVI